MIGHVVPTLAVHNVSISYQQCSVIVQATCTIKPGTLCALIGANGTGKTTFLQGILGLLPLQQGEVTFFGHPLASVRPRVAYVPQRFLVDWDFPLSVYDTVAMGRFVHQKWYAWANDSDKKAINSALEQVALQAQKNTPIGKLSGGQQQRVFIARALAQQADLYILDEPFAAVDEATEKTLLLLLQDLVASGKTVLMVHHDLGVVNRFCDQIVHLVPTSIEGSCTLQSLSRNQLSAHDFLLGKQE